MDLPSLCSQNSEPVRDSYGNTLESEKDGKFNDLFEDVSEMKGIEIQFDPVTMESGSGWKAQITADDIHAAVKHVCMAKAQRVMYKDCITEAREHVIINIPHSMRHYCATGDFYQNMECPWLAAKQVGETCY